MIGRADLLGSSALYQPRWEPMADDAGWLWSSSPAWAWVSHAWPREGDLLAVGRDVPRLVDLPLPTRTLAWPG